MGKSEMGHYEKLYNKMKRNPQNIRYEELEQLLTRKGGFEVRNKGSSHYTFSHPDLAEILTVKKEQPYLKSIYVKKALKLFEQVSQ